MNTKPKYSMSLDEFERIIVPLLLKYPFSSIGYTHKDAQLLFNYSGCDVAKQYEATEALEWICNTATRHATRDLRHNYETLRQAKDDGIKNVKIVGDCRCSCMDFMDGKYANVDGMLSAFEGRSSDGLILPPLEAPCAFDQDRQMLIYGSVSTQQKSKKS